MFPILSMIFICSIPSQMAAAYVTYYSDGLCYDIIYDDAYNDTGNVEVSYPGSKSAYGPDGACESIIVVPESVNINGDTYQVTRVDDYGLQDINLESITLPASITEIGEYAFSECSYLREIISECDSIDVGVNAFKGTEWLVSQKGDFVILNNTLIEYTGDAVNVTIPSNIKTIGSHAFSFANIKSVTIPDSVEKIGDAAFYTCNNLTSVSIPGSVKEIDDSAFEYCSQLSKISFSKGLKSIGERAFSNTNISYLEFPATLEVIGEYAFDNCSKLTAVKFNNGLKEIGVHGFSQTAIGKISIPSSIETIHEAAFSYCTSLSSVVIADGVKRIDTYAFIDCPKLKTVVIPASVNHIGTNAFKNTAYYKTLKKEFCIVNNILIKYNGKSKTVNIPKGVKKISCNFNNNPNLNKIVFPSSLNEICDEAFESCDIDEITIPGSVKAIGAYAFKGCGLKKITLQEGIQEIGDYAFGVNDLTTVTIPKSVVSIGEQVFEYNDLSAIKLSEGLEYIGQWAFRDCNLKEFILPSTVKCINGLALEPNENLESISLSGSLIQIPLFSRGNFNKVTKITLQDGLKSVGCIYQFTKVKRIELPDTLVTIQDNAFSQSSLETIYIPEGTNYIGLEAFSDIVRLKEVSIPDSVKYIGPRCFAGSTNVVFRCNENSVAYQYAMDAGIKVIGPYVKK